MRYALLALLLTVPAFGESAAGIQWTAPAGWKSQGATDFRAATYPVAAVAGDKGAAECAVYFFGKGQGGGVQANLDRWKSQFKGPGGKPVDAKVANRTVHGLTVTTIDVSGDYSGMGGPQGAPSVAAGYRLLGAIVEGPGGSVFVKFAGPGKTMAANEPKFQQLLNSFQKSAQ